ncbi:MAG: hypothetical protein ACTHM7_18305 [Ginsengibacter sp.]
MNKELALKIRVPIADRQALQTSWCRELKEGGCMLLTAFVLLADNFFLLKFLFQKIRNN